MDRADHEESSVGLVRGLGLAQATALNVANMVGIGPFITIPLFLQQTGSPHAMVAWLLALAIVWCDGLVWSELGAAMPGSGGSYHYLREVFGRYPWGRWIVFLYIWQFLLTGALETASGYVGAANFLTFQYPQLEHVFWVPPTPFWPWKITGVNLLAAAAAAIVVAALCRNVTLLGKLSVVLCAGTLLTVLIVIVAGWSNFELARLELDQPITWNAALLFGLAGSMRIAVYDYLGYYNVCHMGEEVRDPARTIPRAVLFSVVLVAAIYLSMNVAIISVVPWRVAMESKNVVADFMTRLFGGEIAGIYTYLIIWTALAGLFSMTLGYSRIPYAAARNGDFFRSFATLHSSGRFPVVSLLAFGGLVIVGCFLQLDVLIQAAVTIRIPMQFVSQIVALHLLRTSRSDLKLPFRMWFYPLPSLIALVGWLFLLATDTANLRICLVVLAIGSVVFLVWRPEGLRKKHESADRS